MLGFGPIASYPLAHPPIPIAVVAAQPYQPWQQLAPIMAQ